MLKTTLSDKQLEKIYQKYEIKSIEASSKKQWLSMWQDYAKTNLPSAKILEKTWQRLLDRDSSVDGFLIYHKNTTKLIGFLHYIVHPDTWQENLSCYIEDVYILPPYRSAGALAMLSDGVITLGKKQRWDRIYWMTKPENKTARRFYNRICTETDWIRYEFKR